MTFVHLAEYLWDVLPSLLPRVDALSRGPSVDGVRPLGGLLLDDDHKRLLDGCGRDRERHRALGLD